TGAQIAYTAGTLGVNVDYTLTANRFSNAFTAITLASASGKTLTLDSGMAAKTITKTGAGTLKLATGSTTANVILQSGVLDMSNALANATVTVASSTASLKGADKLKDTSNINLTNGTLTTSGYVGGTINIAGTSTLTQDATAKKFHQINLVAGSTLNYMAGGVNTLSVGVQQKLIVGNGAISTLNSNLTIGDGGTLSFSGATVNSTASLTLNSHTLTFTDGAKIDLNGWKPTEDVDNYTFNLVSGISGTFDSLGTENITLAQSSLITGTTTWGLNNGTLTLNIQITTPIVWAGVEGNSTWDTTSKNWSKKNETDLIYSNDKYVLFNDKATVKTVTLAAGSYNPMGLTVDTSDSYVFDGEGSIAMTGDKAYLTKEGTGKLVLKNGANSSKHIALNEGSIDIDGTSSLSGGLNMKAGTTLTQNSSATSTLTDVAGSGAIIIKNGKVNLSSVTQGDYTGTVTLTQGHLTNDKTLGNGSLTIATAGKVTMMGVTNAQLASLGTTSTTGNIEWSTAGNISLTGNAAFTLDGTNAGLTFTNGGVDNTFDLTGKLMLNLGKIDETTTEPIIINVLDNGNFGANLGQKNAQGNYSNITLDGANNVFYYVTSLAADGSVTLTQRGRFELTVDNKSTPSITVENSEKVAVVSGADKFKYEDEAGTLTDFKNVVVNGDLYLASKDGDANKTYNVNNLSGTNAGASLIIGGSNGAELNLHNGEGSNTNFAGGIIGETGSTITKTGEGDLTVNGGISSDGKLAINGGTLSTTQANIKDNVAITNGGTLVLTGTGDKAISNMGSLTINDASLLLGTAGNTDSYTIELAEDSLLNNATLAGKGFINIAAGKTLAITGTNDFGKDIILNLKQSENTHSVLDLGNGGAVTVGGLIGKGNITSIANGSLTINTPLGDGLIANYQGVLKGDNTAANPGTVGTIIKTGEGRQALSGTTDANNLYNLTVKEGELILNSDKAIYGDIIVEGTLQKKQMTKLVAEKASSTSVTPAVESPSFKDGTISIMENTFASKLDIKNNGVVNVVVPDKTLTLTGTSTFEAGSTLILNGLHNSNAAIIAKDFVGMDQLHV
ncbi:MAG: hypothetical protein RSF35_09395, partial [Akkermansia sp.]